MKLGIRREQAPGTRHQTSADAETRGRGDAERTESPLPLGEGQGEGRTSTPSTQSSSSTPGSRRSHRPHPRLFVLLALALGAAGWWYFTEVAVPPRNGIVASGTIEAEEVSVASEMAGRVVELPAEEGDRVKAGDVLVKLDDSVPRLQWKMAPMAERQLLELQLDKLTIRSPLDGVVARRSIRLGEVASPAAVLMVITKPDPVELTLYVPEKEIGRVSLGQRVDVKVDSFPEESFPGHVTFIATKAEFTPRNVQTQKDRLNLVFAVKVRIPNGDLRLKPGMPADAVIVLGPEP